MEKLRIATRDSKLAIFQAERFAKLLTQSGLNVEIIKAKTLGDHDTKSPLYELKQVGIFTSELNKMLIDGEAHFAIHSAKDLPSQLEDGVEISLFMDRDDYRDFFVSKGPMKNFKGIIGTSSKRRELFLKQSMGFKDFKIIRGNIDTRIRKFNEGIYDAIIVAKAGLDRLGIEVPGEVIPENIIPPAPNQGIIAVTSLIGSQYSKIARTLQNEAVLWEASHERELMSRLGLGCHNAVGIKSEYSTKTTKFSFTDGERRFDYLIKGEITDKDIKFISDNIW